jgi:succinylglutamate desuccinylase
MDLLYTLQSSRPGPTITIIGAVHGNEFCGYQAIKAVQQTLRVNKGTVHLVVANALALEAKTRFMHYDMNRLFVDTLPLHIKKSYEYQRSREIKQLLDQSDILIDLHASVAGSQPFIICENNGLEIAHYVSVKNILTRIDAFHPGSTDGYMNRRGKIGMCIECGDKETDQSTQFAIQSIKQVLRGLEIIDESIDLNTQQQNQFRSTYIYKSHTQNFTLSQAFTDFDLVLALQSIGLDAQQSIVFDRDYHILFANDSTQVNQECFLLAELMK